MDIRNIEVPKDLLSNITYGNKLELIYELGRIQLAGYRVIEDLPHYPIDINIPRSQVILKDFIGRVIEELAEGYESLSELVDYCQEYGWNINNIENYKPILNSLQNTNEEQADAMGFFITLLLYSNILPEDIFNYVNRETGGDSNNFNSILIYGVKLIIEATGCIPNTGFGLFDEYIADYHGLDYSKINSYSPGFHKLSTVIYENQRQYLWQITYQLNLTRNLLKNRPWKQTQVMSKELDYQESLVKSFILYLGYLTISGFDGDSITELFIRKQQLNLWRQRTGY